MGNEKETERRPATAFLDTDGDGAFLETLDLELTLEEVDRVLIRREETGGEEALAADRYDDGVLVLDKDGERNGLPTTGKGLELTLDLELLLEVDRVLIRRGDDCNLVIDEVALREEDLVLLVEVFFSTVAS